MDGIHKKIQKNHTFAKGFSLLEMVIIVAIISIMTSVMMVVTFQERNTKQLQSAGREMTAALRETQNNALTGKQQGAGLPCAFRFWTNFVDSDNPGDMYRVEGSYRPIDGLCGDDVTDNLYTDSTIGRLFLEEDLSDRQIEIYAYTSNEVNNPNNSHENPYVVFVVPYGKYIDTEQDPVVGDVSIGTEFILKKGDDMYHICIHSTGLIEELGFVSTPTGLNKGDLFMACVF